MYVTIHGQHFVCSSNISLGTSLSEISFQPVLLLKTFAFLANFLLICLAFQQICFVYFIFLCSILVNMFALIFGDCNANIVSGRLRNQFFIVCVQKVLILAVHKHTYCKRHVMLRVFCLLICLIHGFVLNKKADGVLLGFWCVKTYLF